MAHYDCTHCGARLGIAYGICKECTPQEVFDAELKLKLKQEEAEKLWEEQINDKYRLFIHKHIKAEKEAYDEIYKKNDPWFKKKTNG